MLIFSNDRLEIIKKYEGFRPKTYDDATGKSIDSLEGLQGTMLVGYGTANNVPLGIVFPAGFTIGEEQALRWLSRVVNQKADVVNKRFRDIELNQNQFDAIVMLCYNVGEICIKPEKSLFQYLLAKDYKKASEVFLKYNKIAGVENSRLTERRHEEMVIFCSTI